MLTAQYADLVVWFYPIGNTPAVSLTRGQPLAGDSKTNILLLGCGDVRHILFTTYMDGRPMDITCCDREKAVLARNIILLTLLIDDDQGARITRHWKLFYHLYISDEDLLVLRKHAKRLYALSSSLEEWNRGPYGKTIRFADRCSLTQVREMWELYAGDTPGFSLRSFESRYHYWLQKSIGVRSQRGVCTGGLRSLYPAPLEYVDEVNALKDEFWEDLPQRYKTYRQTEIDVRFNPMFAVTGATTRLHYRTDPLDGYHVALAYIPNSGPVILHGPDSHPPLEIGKAEFCSWSFAFRKCVRKGLVLRFFSGDALNFCHTLQHVRQHPDERTAHLYRDRYTFEPLTLDGNDWDSGGFAPLTFTVIDTSNLLDHLDGLNLLPAVSPLLTCEPSACLYTELLIGRERTPDAIARSVLRGDLTTLGLLLGLTSCDFCMNTSNLSAGHEALVEHFKRMGVPTKVVNQKLIPITWKRTLSHGSTPELLEPLHLPEDGLARILMALNRELFSRENSTPALQKMSLCELPNDGGHLSLCHRGSLATLISLIKSRVTTDMKETVKLLLAAMRSDTKLALSDWYLEEFILHLHLQGILTDKKLESPHQLSHKAAPSANSILSWVNLPPVVAITLVIPRSKLSPFMQGDGPISNIGTPFLECIVESSKSGLNAFAAFQMGFGTLSTSGKKWTDSFQLRVSDDKSAWAGRSTMIVSFLVPSWILIAEPENTKIALCIKSSPDSMHFVPQLGLELVLFGAFLSDTEHVFISKNLPNQTSRIGPCGFAACDIGAPEVADQLVEQSLGARMSIGNPTEIMGFTRRLDIKSPELTYKLCAKELVTATYVSPWTFLVHIGDSTPLVVNFPVPVDRFAFTISIVRTLGFPHIIEISDTLANGPAWVRSGGSAYPIIWNSSHHTLWNLTYLPISRLPEIMLPEKPEDMRDLRWLQHHITTLLSSPERRIGLRAEESGDYLESCHPAQLARYRLKDTLYHMFMSFDVLSEQRPTAFAIGVGTQDLGQIIILPVKLRLDLSSRAVVLDTLVLPVTESVVKNYRKFLLTLDAQGISRPDVSEAELVLWKSTLPAWVERCRTWKHKVDCEYFREKSMPLPTLEVLCSCGNGMDLPEIPASGWPDWEEVRKLCIRAAISPMFPCPLVEEVFGDEMYEESP